MGSFSFKKASHTPEEKIVRSAPPSSTRPVFMEQSFLSVYS